MARQKGALVARSGDGEEQDSDASRPRGTQDNFDSDHDDGDQGHGELGVQRLAGGTRSLPLDGSDTDRRVSRHTPSAPTAPEGQLSSQPLPGPPPLQEPAASAPAGDLLELTRRMEQMFQQQEASLDRRLQQHEEALARQFQYFRTGIERKLGEVVRQLQETKDTADEAKQLAQEVKDEAQGLAQRVSALEQRMQGPRGIDSRIQEVQASYESMAADVTSQVQAVDQRAEQLDQDSRAASMMVFGLPDHEGGSNEPELIQEIGSRIEHATASFSGATIVSARRLGRFHADRPRAVRVVLQTPTDKHMAFKAKSTLRQDRIRLDDDLTEHQQRQRSAQQPIADNIRSLGQGHNPHFVRGVLHIWEDGACTPFERSELRRNGSMDMGGGDRTLPARPSGPRRANATPDRAAGRA